MFGVVEKVPARLDKSDAKVRMLAEVPPEDGAVGHWQPNVLGQNKDAWVRAGGLNATQVANVAGHELGHWMGIRKGGVDGDGHTADPGNLMLTKGCLDDLKSPQRFNDAQKKTVGQFHDASK